MHEPRPLLRAKFSSNDPHGRVLRHVLVAGGGAGGDAERAKGVAAKEPRGAVDVDGDKVAAIARGVDGADADVGEGAEDVWFEEVGVPWAGWVGLGRRERDEDSLELVRVVSECAAALFLAELGPVEGMSWTRFRLGEGDGPVRAAADEDWSGSVVVRIGWQRLTAAPLDGLGLVLVARHRRLVSVCCCPPRLFATQPQLKLTSPN